jgi:hypothetical protein
MGNAIIRTSTFTLHPTQLSWSCTYQLTNGETKTGVTTFIDDKIDTGAMILSSETPIEETEMNNCTTDGSGK